MYPYVKQCIEFAARQYTWQFIGWGQNANAFSIEENKLQS